jgi:hypothetical protein
VQAASTKLDSVLALIAIVMPFVGEAHGDAVFAEGPDFLDQAVIKLARPFARQKGDDARVRQRLSIV